jgi:hypothetical protein
MLLAGSWPSGSGRPDRAGHPASAMAGMGANGPVIEGRPGRPAAVGRIEPFADNATVGGCWHIQTAACRERPRLRRSITPIPTPSPTFSSPRAPAPGGFALRNAAGSPPPAPAGCRMRRASDFLEPRFPTPRTRASARPPLTGTRQPTSERRRPSQAFLGGARWAQTRGRGD